MKQYLISQLETVFSAEPWYGDSVSEVLERIPARAAVTRVKDRSMLLYLRHMLVWRDFVLRQLRGEAKFTVEIGGPVDWPLHLPENPEDWDAALEQLKTNQAELLAALQAFPDEFLLETVPGRSFNFAFMLNGLVQHDIYHLGQISLLKRLV